MAEELTERIGFTMKETKKEDEYHAKVTTDQTSRPLNSLISTKIGYLDLVLV